MSEKDVANLYVQPLFKALGWDVWVPPGMSESISDLFDLELAYRELRIPVEVKKFRDTLSTYSGRDANPWGILTNFETILIWDISDPNPNLVLESSPRS